MMRHLGRSESVRMLRTFGVRLGLLALLLVVSSCVSGTRGTTRDPFSGGGGGGGAGADELRISVRNSNFNDATITALAPGFRRRLGRVSGADQGSFRIPWRFANELHFEVDLLGGQRCTTRRVSVSPGMRVTLMIDSNPRPRSDGLTRLCEVSRG